MTYKIVHDRENCIGCGACAAIAPDHWEMADDGKSKAKKTEIEESELDINKQAAQACPVQVIHIKDKDGNDIQ